METFEQCLKNIGVICSDGFLKHSCRKLFNYQQKKLDDKNKKIEKLQDALEKKDAWLSEVTSDFMDRIDAKDKLLKEAVSLIIDMRYHGNFTSRNGEIKESSFQFLQRPEIKELLSEK